MTIKFNTKAAGIWPFANGRTSINSILVDVDSFRRQ